MRNSPFQHRFFHAPSRAAAAFFGVAILIATAFATALASADSPASQPAADGPRDTFKAFFLAIAQGHSADIPSLCVATDHDSQVLVHDFQDLSAAIGSLLLAVATKFGLDAVDTVMPQLASSDDIDAMTETIDGDHADLVGDNIGPAKMVRTDGKWKLDITALRQSPDLPSDPHAYFAALTREVKRTTDDVTAGRYDTAAIATETLRARQEAIATTQP
jgi:hypothetical protein